MASYVADFETTTNNQLIKEGKTRVWAYGVCQVGDVDNEEIGNNIDDFMKWCERTQNPTVYFHNLKFDSSFILSWLFQNGFKYSEDKEDKTFSTIISSTGQFYVVEVIFKKLNKKYNKVVFYDSLKKLPFKVEVIAKSFDLPIRKLIIDYHKYRPEGYELTKEDVEYVRNDIRVIAMALEIQFSQGLKRMTVGSDSLKDYKNIITNKRFETLFPVLSLEMDKQIRMSYKGGWTYANEKYQGKDLGKGLVYDVNSLYPSVMMYKVLPFGMPVFYTGKYVEDKEYVLYIEEILCTFKLKKDRVPTIQLKGHGMGFKPTEYLKTNGEQVVRLHLTNVDMELFLQQYDVNIIEHVCGYKFRGQVGMFTEYINKWNSIKSTNSGGLRELAKLQLNSLYGKFATNPDITGKTPYFDEKSKTVKFKMAEKEFRTPVYTAMGSFVTAYARSITINVAQDNYERFVYADTDSVHLVGTEIPNIEVHDTKIGAWKLEGQFNRARILGAKAYIEEYSSKISDNKKMFRIDEDEVMEEKFEMVKDSEGNISYNHLDVKCAGMPDAVKENVCWENFRVGFTSEGKLRPSMEEGGIVLKDTPFTLHKR